MYNIYHVIYKTTNLINNKFYIGKHSTIDPHDLYLGSGNRFLLAVEKYGRENFKKEILFIFETEDEAYEKEAELVTKELIENPNCYNLQTGGLGGRKASSGTKQKLSNIHSGKILSEEHKNKISKSISGKNNPNYGKTGSKHHNYGVPLTREHRNKVSRSRKGIIFSQEHKDNISKSKSGKNHPNYGKTHSKETKKKMSKPREKVKCPHCNKIGGISSMKRWHFDKCKFNPFI